MGYGLINIVVCVVFRSKWTTCFHSVEAQQAAAVTEFLRHENETPIGIHPRLMAFYAEDTVDASTVRHWVTKSRDSGGNLYLNDQLQSGRPVSATRDLNRQKVDELI